MTNMFMLYATMFCHFDALIDREAKLNVTVTRDAGKKSIVLVLST